MLTSLIYIGGGCWLVSDMSRACASNHTVVVMTCANPILKINHLDMALLVGANVGLSLFLFHDTMLEIKNPYVHGYSPGYNC